MTGFFHRKRAIGFFITSLIFACLLAWFINAFTPDTFLSQCLFFGLLAAVVFFLCLFIFADRLPAGIISMGSVIYFFLRLLHLRHPLYLLLVCICCYSVYHFFSAKKPASHL